MNDQHLTSGTQADHDPQETQEWLDSLDYVVEAAGTTGPPICSNGSATGSARAALRCRRRSTRRTSTPFPPTTNRVIRATARSSGGSRASSAGTRWRWWSRPTNSIAASADTFRLSPRRPRCTKSPSTTFPRGEERPQGGDLIYFQGHASPGSMRALSRRSSDGREPASTSAASCRTGPGLVVLSASLSDAGFLGISHGLDGTRADHVDLPGALQPLSARPRP